MDGRGFAMSSDKTSDSYALALNVAAKAMASNEGRSFTSLDLHNAIGPIEADGGL